jgi:hypothetical protein
LLTGADLVKVLPDFEILVVAGVVFCALALVSFRLTESYARRGGSLVQY